MSLTTQRLIEIVGTVTGGEECDFLLEADRYAAKCLTRGEGVLISDTGQHFHAIHKVADKVRDGVQGG